MDNSSKNYKHYKKSMIDEYEMHSSNSSSSTTNKSNLNTDYSLNSEKSSNQKLYCVCKTPDTQRFMIACDNCDEWFHGDCVGISEAFSKKIKSYFCHICRFKNSKLNIKYKKKFTEQEIKEKFSREIHLREAKENELCRKLKEELKNKSNNNNENTINKEQELANFDVTKLNSSGQYGKSRISGEDIENFVSAIAKFGSEVNTTTSTSVNQQCQSPPTSTVKSPQTEISSLTSSPSKLNKVDEISHSVSVDGGCSMSSFNLNQNKKRYLSESADDVVKLNEDKVNIDETKLKKKRGRKKKIQNPIDQDIDSDSYHTHKHRRHSLTSSRSKNANINDNDEFNDKKYDEIKQCLGPGCTKPANISSKYCSDECGIQLGERRIFFFLKENPINIENNKSFKATHLNELQLAKTNNEIDIAKQRLNDLDYKHSLLDSIIKRAQYEKINENIEIEKESDEAEIYCVTCGHLLNERHALKHMEKCFNKYESQAFFGSYYKSHPEGQTIFCDFYNSQTKMYCKRLKVMCPEHEKERKINDDEVCGCPLAVKENFFQESNNICLASKRNCQAHFKWEKLRRAQIDLEKLQLGLKLDELYEQKRLIEISMNNRNGLLSSILHQTIAHGQIN